MQNNNIRTWDRDIRRHYVLHTRSGREETKFSNLILAKTTSRSCHFTLVHTDTHTRNIYNIECDRPHGF